MGCVWSLSVVQGRRRAAHSASESPTPHDPGDPVPATGVARSPQRTVQPRAAIGTAMSHEKRVDLHAHGFVGALPFARPALTPGVKARARHVEGRAQVTDRIGVFHGLDHGETLPFGPAKIPTAFFKMSRWLVTLWSCARSRRTSAANSWLVGATAGSLAIGHRGWLGVCPAELPPRTRAGSRR